MPKYVDYLGGANQTILDPKLIQNSQKFSNLTSQLAKKGNVGLITWQLQILKIEAALKYPIVKSTPPNIMNELWFAF